MGRNKKIGIGDGHDLHQCLSFQALLHAAIGRAKSGVEGKANLYSAENATVSSARTA